jgi:hypothetical protein
MRVRLMQRSTLRRGSGRPVANLVRGIPVLILLVLRLVRLTLNLAIILTVALRGILLVVLLLRIRILALRLALMAG